MEINNEQKCKNCGNEILLFRGKWIHSWSGSIRCKSNRKVHAEPEMEKIEEAEI